MPPITAKREHDLEARVSFLRTSEGGRWHAAGGDGRYRPSHDFGRRGFNDGVHVFMGKAFVPPGESVLAQIWLLSPESQRHYPTDWRC